MQNELMGEVVFASQYARQTEGGRESWSDAVDRVVEMHVEKYPQLEDEIKDAFNLVKERCFQPGQRKTCCAFTTFNAVWWQGHQAKKHENLQLHIFTSRQATVFQ
jgi:hypothetical protein